MVIAVANLSLATSSPALFLRGHNFEGRIGFFFYRSLLGHFTPPTSTLRFASMTGRERHVAGCFWNDSLIRKFATSDKLLGKTTTIKRLGVGVDGVGEDVWFGR